MDLRNNASCKYETCLTYKIVLTIQFKHKLVCSLKKQAFKT